MGLDMKALREKAKQRNANKPDTFTPMELNEGNVQAIFERCLAKSEGRKRKSASLFPVVTGYKPVEKPIEFDLESLLDNKKAIEYLYGQLQEIHTIEPSSPKKYLTIDDYNKTYQGTHWTKDKTTLLKFLYLGVCPETSFIAPFSAKTDTSFINVRPRPTLSPKDPAFPAWWKQHRAEWEA